MWDSLFDVDSGEDCEWPEEVAEVGVDEHCPSHTADCKVGAFSDAILRGGVWDGFLV